MSKAILVIVLLTAACSDADPATTTATLESAAMTSAAIAPETTTSQSTTSTAPPTTVPQTTSTTVDASLVVSGIFTPGFSMRVPDGTFLAPGIAEGNFRGWTGPNDSWLLVHRGTNTIEDWAETFSEAGATPTDLEDVTVGGMPGQMFEATPTRTFQLLPGHFLEDGDATRVYVIEVDGTSVSILGVTDPEHFDSWAGVIEEMLSTLEWAD
jgi:hypothetical protein